MLKYKILTTILLLATNLTGCASWNPFSTEKPIEVVTKPLERTQLNLPDPAPLRLKNIEWIVITPQNWEEVFKRMQDKEQTLVLFGLTDDGYKELAVTITQLRGFIAAQKVIIDEYRNYYEPKK